MTKTCATPKISTLDLTSSQRSLGKLVKLNLSDTELNRQEPVQDLAGEAFFEYFLNEPVAKEETPVEREINRRVLDWARKSPDWENNRSASKGNIMLSALSAPLLAQNLMTDDALKDALKKEDEANKKEKQAENLEKQAKDAENSNQPKAAQSLSRKAQEARQDAQELRNQANGIMDKVEGSPVAQGIRKNALDKTNAEAKELSEFAQSWGINPGDTLPENVDDVLAELKKRQADMAAITPLMGRVKGISTSIRTKRQKKGMIAVNAGYTRDLSKAFPAELAMLRPDANPILRAIKIGEFADRGLLGMVPGSDPQKCGKLIMAVDDSGSMQSDQRDIKASALTLGICEAALENGQNYHAWRFDVKRSLDSVPSITDQSPARARMDFAVISGSGGTSFDWALNHSMDIIDLENDPENCDIIIITDGASYISNTVAARFFDMKSRLGTRLIYLGVGGQGSQIGGELEKLSTAVLQLDDGKEIDNIAARLSEILAADREAK